MNKLIATLFAATLSLGTFSAYAATNADNVDDASSLGTAESPQHKQQYLRTDKGPTEMNTGSVKDDASNLGNSETPQLKEQNKRTEKGPAQDVNKHHAKKSKLMKIKEENGGTTKGNPVQPNQPEGAAPAVK